MRPALLLLLSAMLPAAHLAAWEANPAFGMGDEVTLAKVRAARAELAKCDADITALTTQLTALRNDEEPAPRKVPTS